MIKSVALYSDYCGNIYYNDKITMNSVTLLIQPAFLSVII
jgi:hypothetical protein